MAFRHYVPPPPLSDFIGMLWYCHNEAPVHSKERILPHGSMQLIVNLRTDRMRVFGSNGWQEGYGGVLLAGPYSQSFVVDPAGLAEVMGVEFKPGGATPFFGFSAAELHNQDTPLDAVWGRTALSLKDRLIEARTVAHKFRILEKCLLDHMRHPARRYDLVRYAASEFQSIPHVRTIASVASQAGISQARFIRIFRESAGLTPKLYCRLRRFQEVLRLINGGKQIHWADLASACGYFDQAHFIHDFRAFSGMSPTAYLTDRSVHQNHVLVRD